MNGFDEWFKCVDLLTSEPHTEEELRTIAWFGRIVWSAALKSKEVEKSASPNKAMFQLLCDIVDRYVPDGVFHEGDDELYERYMELMAQQKHS